MTSFTITKTFSNEQYTKLSPASSASTPYNPSNLTFTAIDSSLPGGKWLIYPLVVQIQREDGEVLVSEPHFYMHAVGPTVAEAIAEFKRILVDELQQLEYDEKRLGPRLKKQLQYLRSIIRMA